VRLKTDVSHFCFGARIARDFAAPMEDTVAPFPRGVQFCPIAPPTAHQIAAVHPNGRRVARTVVRAAVPDARVLCTKRRRALKVHEVLRFRRLVVRIHRDQIEAVFASFHGAVSCEGYKDDKEIRG
jgi:hypothetical protein